MCQKAYKHLLHGSCCSLTNNIKSRKSKIKNLEFKIILLDNNDYDGLAQLLADFIQLYDKVIDALDCEILKDIQNNFSNTKNENFIDYHQNLSNIIYKYITLEKEILNKIQKK